MSYGDEIIDGLPKGLRSHCGVRVRPLTARVVWCSVCGAWMDPGSADREWHLPSSARSLETLKEKRAELIRKLDALDGAFDDDEDQEANDVLEETENLVMGSLLIIRLGQIYAEYLGVPSEMLTLTTK